jgi:regulator of replication initiation timing
LGDPLSVVRNFDERRSQLEQQRQSLVARLQQLEEKNVQLDAEELRLRSGLSQRYGVEFPKLGLDKPERERTTRPGAVARPRPRA